MTTIKLGVPSEAIGIGSFDGAAVQRPAFLITSAVTALRTDAPELAAHPVDTGVSAKPNEPSSSAWSARDLGVSGSASIRQCVRRSCS